MLLVNSNSEVRNCFRIVFIFFPKTLSRHCVSHQCFHVNWTNVTAKGESFKATYRRIDLKHSIEERFELMRNKKIPTYKMQKYKAEHNNWKLTLYWCCRPRKGNSMKVWDFETRSVLVDINGEKQKLRHTWKLRKLDY